MKLKLIFTLFTIAVIFSGCATIFKGSGSNVYFIGGPEDLKIYDDKGERIHLERKEANELYSFSDSFKDEMGGTTTTYYAWGYKFSDATKDYTLTLVGGSKEVKVKLEPSMAMKWFWLDLFTGGIIVDAITGAWYELAEVNGEMNVVNVSKHFK